MPPRRAIALRYMTEFSCIGADCEDTCCGGQWNIEVDQSSYDRVRKAMRRHPTLAARFDETFAVNPPTVRDRVRFAMIQQKDGCCPLLDGGWCTLHKELGTEVLPPVCATYPREVSIVADRLELAGALSCPEVARRALLQEGAVDLVETEAARAAVAQMLRRLDARARDPYDAELDEVRGTIYQLLSIGEYPLPSRLFFALCFAERVGEFFHRGTTNFDRQRLEREVTAIADAALCDALHAELADAPADGPAAMSLLGQLIAARLYNNREPKLLVLLDRVLASFEGAGVRAQGGAFTLSPEPLFAAWAARRDALRARHGERIDRYFENYARLTAIREWYTDSPSLLVYVQNLALRTALVRFFFFGHPALRGEVDDALLDRTCVECFYLFSRSIEHSSSFLEAMNRALAQTLRTLPSTIPLLKF
jgi:lysine-N-methylase